MNKNLFILSLLAIGTSISTAQTYTATAGTNGTTDIQSDYSMSTGDGASVSVDVPLEFELPKKVAIAVKSPDSAFTSNPLFANALIRYTPVHSLPFNGQYYGGDSNAKYSSQVLLTEGAVYSNTEAVLSIQSSLVFQHESDPSSQIEAGCWLSYHTDAGWSSWIGWSGPNNSTVENACAAQNYNVNPSELTTTNNLMSMDIHRRIIMDSVEPTDRAGKYLNTQTITISTL